MQKNFALRLYVLVPPSQEHEKAGQLNFLYVAELHPGCDKLGFWRAVDGHEFIVLAEARAIAFPLGHAVALEIWTTSPSACCKYRAHRSMSTRLFSNRSDRA